MSDAVERRIVALLEKPLVCPHGNPIPGLDQLGLPFATATDGTPLVSLTEAVASGADEVVVDRISELLQPDASLMHRLREAGMRPGQSIGVASSPAGVQMWLPGAEPTVFERRISDHVFVRVRERSTSRSRAV